MRAEAAEGADRGMLIPVTIDETTPPLRFRSIQAANLIRWNGTGKHEGMDELIEAIRSLSGTDPTPMMQSNPMKSNWDSSKTIATAEVETGPTRGRSISLSEATTSVAIGRSEDCDFIVNDAYVSRSHCRLVVNLIEPGFSSAKQYSFSVVDSGGPGTLVNGELIHHTKELSDGDRFQVGNIRFVFRVPECG